MPRVGGRCLAWDVSPVAPTPFGFLLLLFCVCVCVLYYKFILYITRGAPNKAVKKKIPTISMVLKGPHKTTEVATKDTEMG